MSSNSLASETDYRHSLVEASALMDRNPPPGTADGVRLDVLVQLIESYEALHYPIELPAT